MSSILVALGLLAYFLAGRGWQNYPTTLKGVILGLREGEPVALIETGLLLLMITPVMRVGAALAAFIRERDSSFVLISLYVLGALLFSLLTGK